MVQARARINESQAEQGGTSLNSHAEINSRSHREYEGEREKQRCCPDVLAQLDRGVCLHLSYFMVKSGNVKHGDVTKHRNAPE